MAEGVATQPLEVSNFSGGMTDNYIGNPDTSKFQKADNMVLIPYGQQAKLFTVPGSQVYDSTYYRIPSNSRLSGLAENENALFQISCPNVYTIASGWKTIQGPTGNAVFDAGTASTNYASWAKWNKHLLLVNDALATPQKIYFDGTNWVSRTLGLPQITASSITATPAVGANSWVYCYVQADSYTIGTVTFREVSKTSALKAVTSAAFPVSHTNIPVLANGGTGNYNTSTSTIEIYRTTNGGTVFYYVGQVTNGTTTFSDSVSDATLITNATLYTTGGVVDFDQVPKSKYVVVSGDTAFYLGVQEGSQVKGNRVRQSIPGSLYASPATFFVDLSSDIVGGAVVNGYPILFCQNKKIYRIEGKFDSFGQGGMLAREISNTVECVSHRSIVQTPEGIAFAAEGGFYGTDGNSVTKLTNEINTTYALSVATSAQKAKIYGAYDPINRRVEWSVQLNGTSNDNDTVFVAHAQWPNIPFTTLSGGDQVDNFSPTSMLYFNGQMLRGDRRGYLFARFDSSLTHPKIDTTQAPSLWSQQAIIYDYKSNAYDFGSTLVRKWVPRIVVNANNTTNLSLQVTSNTDNNGIFAQLSEISFRGNSPWNESDGPNWNGDGIRWNFAPIINQWRRFPTPLRCAYRQVRFTNAHSTSDTSANLGTVTVNSTLKTITLDNVANSFTPNAVDYYISFPNDSYTQEWQITARNSATVLTVLDADNHLTNLSGTAFLIKGSRKNEVLNLLSYAIDFGFLTTSQTTYRTQT